MNETPDQQSPAYQVYAQNSAQAHGIDAQNAALEAELGFTAPPPAGDKPGPKTHDISGQSDIAGTIEKNLKEIPGAIGGGITDAIQGIGNTAIDLYDWADKYAKENGYIDGQHVPTQQLDFSNSIFPPEETATGKLTRAATSFLAPFLTGTGAASKLASIPKWARVAGVGAAVDFSVWDPKGDRLSNLIQDVPWMANPISEYLASKPGDTAVDGRFKQMLEGAGLGALTEGMFLAVKGLRGVSHANEAAQLESRSLAPAVDGNAGLKTETGASTGADLTSVNEASANQTADRADSIQTDIVTPNSGAAKQLSSPAAIEFPHSVPEDGNFLEPVVSGAKDVQVTGSESQGFKVNLNKVTASTDALKILKESSFQFQPEISKAARGVVTDESRAAALAHDLGITVQEFMSRPAGQALNVEQMDKARMFLAYAAEDFATKAKAAFGPGSTDMDKAIMADALDGLRVLQAQLGGAKAETARTMRSLRTPIGAAKGERLASIIDQVIKTNGRDNLEEIARIVTDAASKPDVEMANFLGTWQRKSMFMKAKDALWETWINGLLSRPSTHIVNATSNTLAATNNIFETGLARASSLIRGGDVADGVAAGELTAKITGLFEGALDASKLVYRQSLGDIQGKLSLNKFADASALKATELSKGTYLDETLKTEQPRVPAISSQNFDFSQVPVIGSTINKFIDVVGGAVRLPSYAMNSSDMFFKLANYRMELNAQAVRNSVRQGLTGKKFSDNVSRLVANPPDNLFLQSRDAALYHTYNNELEGSLAHLDDFIKSVPALRLTFPFTRTPSNIFMYGLDRMPGLNLIFSSDIRGNFLKPTREGDFARAKVASGMAMSGAIVWLAKDYITGSGPMNSEAKKAKEATGWREDSIKLGDTYYQYKRVDPFGNIMGMAADYAELAGHLNDKDQQSLALAMAGLTIKNLTPEFLVQHASQLVDAIKDPDKNGQAFLAALSASAVPGIVKDIRKSQDPAKRDTSADPNDSSTSQIWQKIVNGIKASLPGWSETLPPLRNMFGEVVNYDPGIGPDTISPISTSKETNDPVIKEIVRLNLAGPLFKMSPKPGERDLTLSMPPRQITVNGISVQLSPKEYSDYVLLSAGVGLPHAPTLKQALGALIKTRFPSVRNDQQRRDAILDVVHTYREAATGQLVKNDNLYDRIQKTARSLKELKTRNDKVVSQ